MADLISSEARSRNMSAIKSKNTKVEVYFRKLLFHAGYRYSLHSNKIPGHPDLFMAMYNTAVYIHGCFWHRHPNCKHAYKPKSREEFWMAKFESNIQRDIIVTEQLKDRHIKQLIIWECTINQMIKNPDVERKVLSSVETFLTSSIQRLEL